MQMLKNKSIAIAITLILATSMAISIGTLQTVQADVRNGINYDAQTTSLIDAGMYWAGMPYNISANPNRLLLWNRFHDQIPTWSFGIASPNPVGVGQTFNLIMMNPQVPPNALLGNDIRYTFKISILKPDGTTENLPKSGQSGGNVGAGQGGVSGDHFVSDSTGSTYTAYTPDQVGNYSITVNFLGLKYLWYNNNPSGSTPEAVTARALNGTSTQGDNSYYGTTFKPSSYTLIVTVQQDPVSIRGEPLIQPVPTEYWTRPIEGQNDQWYTVSSNWLCNSKDRDNGGNENRFQEDGIAPNSPHILWTRPTEDNGIVGGTGVGREGAGNSFNAGSQYQPRFNTQIIMYGRLYFTPNLIYQGTSEVFDAVDLRTGELLYEVNTTKVTGASRVPAFGYYYSDDNPNEHGIANPGWLFSRDYAVGYQPERGIPYLNITGVPSGFESMGPAGENLRYVLSGSTTTGYGLGQWNSSLAISSRNPSQNLVNCSVNPLNYYDWNVSIGKLFSSSPTIRAVRDGEYIWGSNGSWPTGTSGPSYYYPSEVTVWAISIKPENRGQLIYMKNIDVDDEATNQNLMFERASGAEERFVALQVPSCTFFIFDMATGNFIAKTAPEADFEAYGYFTWPSLISATQTKMAYGTLFTGGYTGAVSAYSLADGRLLWRDEYPSGGMKIPNFVQMIGLIADGKIYVGTHEHSADTPLYKGERVHALNVTNGATVWDMSGWAYPMTFALGDGILIYWNNYDGQIYSIGKGPTSTTVTAPDAGVPFGTPVVIRGTVLDISAGTKQKEQAARFPNGVAAVSDAAQAQWMEYVYMQKGKPNNTTGVPVTISVVDANGNFRQIGQATTDQSGMFSYTWKPDIEGSYTVIASFAGSESYWPSNAESSFAVSSAAATTAPQVQQISLPPTELYFAVSTIAIIMAIAIVGLLLLKKRA